ncbi:GNAT family N-acetyltransferase [Gordonia sp. X0973]|uniref:GNAT family N-acetyltransferase n=1 Tax=Gordonia sp. X0973 TaxID=2742602 RepID=UPI000F547EF9|nr:N-acetyltransferase [Gordonia sp. X0973]QKT07590.1 GNAT family N-acetyltransferase [Gordonia sp. X0973]
MVNEPTGPPVDVRIVRLPGGDAHRWLDPALNVYVTAMGYPRGVEAQRRTLWRQHIARPGWNAFGAVAPLDHRWSPGTRLRPSVMTRRIPRLAGAPDSRDEILLGIAYGYRGAPDQWWNQQLRIGLRQAGCPPDRAAHLLADYFELTELHVHPDAQGLGVGQALLNALLHGRPEARVLLSTPEVAGEGNRAWALYRRFGFGDVLRNFTFAGDPRPFAFLGRDLPIPTTDGPALRSSDTRVGGP